MAQGIILNKDNLKSLLDELKARYKVNNIEELEKKIWEDKELQDIVLYSNMFRTEKKIRIRTKEGSFLKKNFILGSKDKTL